MKRQIEAQIICTVFCALLTILPSESNAQTKDASYFCTAEAAGGLAYNKLQKKWEGVGFHATDKFILRLKFLRANYLKDQTDVIYEVTITEAGKSDTRQCISHGNKEVLVGGLGRVVFCTDFGDDYRINLKNNRYLKTSTWGYYSVGSGKFISSDPKDLRTVPDNDEDSDTPYVEGGICTKIE